MSIFRNDTLGSWTRGGQAIVHNVRMTTQVFKQTVLAGFILWLMGTGAYVWQVTEEHPRRLLVTIAAAWFQKNAVSSPTSAILFPMEDGRQYWTTAQAVLDAGIARKVLAALEKDLVHGAIISGCGTLLMLFCAWYYFTKSGRGLGSNQYLRGARFATPRQLRRHLFWSKKGCLKVGGVRIPAAFEPEHILVSGAPGTGKTNLLNFMLDGIRKEGKRAIVYDTAGTFVERFYRPAETSSSTRWMRARRNGRPGSMSPRTIITTRSRSLWSLIRQRPVLGQVGAGHVRCGHAQACKAAPHADLGVLDILTRSGLKDLAAFVEKTDGAAFISSEGERTSAGIQPNSPRCCAGSITLDDTDRGLSIRDWITNETDDSWLFVTVKADQLPTLRPLITMWGSTLPSARS